MLRKAIELLCLSQCSPSLKSPGVVFLRADHNHVVASHDEVSGMCFDQQKCFLCTRPESSSLFQSGEQTVPTESVACALYIKGLAGEEGGRGRGEEGRALLKEEKTERRQQERG